MQRLPMNEEGNLNTSKLSTPRKGDSQKPQTRTRDIAIGAVLTALALYILIFSAYGLAA